MKPSQSSFNFINAFLGFWQEINAQKSLDSLREMNNRFATVFRNGEWQKVPTSDVVIGDMIQVKLGDFVEADVRWIQADELQVNESHLTGEADAVSKHTDTIDKDVALADRTNMGYSGSIVANGQGVGIVVGIGQNTELGNIADLISSVEDKPSPLQSTISRLTRTLMLVSGAIVIFTLAVGILRAGELSVESLISVLSTSIALAVASIPDALPAVLSIVLTIGASKMAKENGLIKSLNSVETLGSTSYIASDKTGTLTQNKMTVTKFYDGQHTYNVSGQGYELSGNIEADDGTKVQPSIFLEGALLANESTITEENNKVTPFGNPTEIALNVLGRKANLTKDDLLKDNTIIRTLPFTSQRKMMSVVVKTATGYRIYTKGAPDVLLRNCKNIY
jgi:Cation transport ATPase